MRVHIVFEEEEVLSFRGVLLLEDESQIAGLEGGVELVIDGHTGRGVDFVVLIELLEQFIVEIE